MDKSFCERHEECRLRPLPRDVSDDDSQALLRQIDEIIVITSNLEGRCASRGYIQLGHARISFGEKTHLNITRNFQLLLQPLPLSDVLREGRHDVFEIGDFAPSCLARQPDHDQSQKNSKNDQS